MTELQWLPIKDAPHDGRRIAVLLKKGEGWYGDPIVVSWTDSMESGWWLEEGALYSDDQVFGWSPLPPLPK